MTRLIGKVAFITGAATGIGRATAVLFAREGAQVVVADIATVAGEETAHLAGNGAIAIRTDVTDEASLQAAIRITLDTFGRLDVLHNNAGGSTPQDNPVVEAPIEEFWRVIKGDGPCNAERLGARRKAHDDGAWVREAMEAYAQRPRGGEGNGSG